MNENKKSHLRLKEKKVVIIGAGHVGASIAYSLAIKEIAHKIVLIDIDKNKADAEALDIQHGISNMGEAEIYAGDYCECKDSGLIIIAAGRNRRTNETRLQMLQDNSIIIDKLMHQLSKHYNGAGVLIVTNPVEPLVLQCSKFLGQKNGIVFGTGCMLDTSRLIKSMALYANVKVKEIEGFVAGEHGDNQVVIWSRLFIKEAPIEEYFSNLGRAWGKEQKAMIASIIKKMGMDIICGKGYTQYGIATCVCYIADAVLNNRNVMASVSSCLQGEYGLKNVALSLPSVIGENGVEQIIEEEWEDAEISALERAAEVIEKTTNLIMGNQRRRIYGS